MKRQVVIDMIVFLLMLLFVYAAVNKLVSHEKFVTQIGQSPLLTRFTVWVAWGIPAFEIFIAVLLALPRMRLIGLHLSFFMMVMFTAYIIAILSFSDTIPCSCGGILEKLGWKEHLVFNVGFVLLSLWGILLQARQQPKTTTA